MAGDPVTEKLNREVEAAKDRLLKTLAATQPVWPCAHCGQPRSHKPTEPWIPNDLCEAAGMTRDPVSMIALNTMASEGRIVFTNDWRVHLPEGPDAR